MVLSSRPTLGASDAWDRRPTLLSRTTNLGSLPLFAPGAVVRSTLISFEIPLSWHTFRTGVWDQICADAENTRRNLRGDPQRHRLFGRLTRFLELFKKRHSEMRDKAKCSRRYARLPRGRLSSGLMDSHARTTSSPRERPRILTYPLWPGLKPVLRCRSNSRGTYCGV